jgi:hypothetical protein
MDEPQDVLKHYVSTGVPGLDHILKGGFLVFHPSEVELGETTRQILAEVERTKPKHVVFDGLSELWLLAADALRYRRRLLSLKHYFEEQKITVLLLDDRTNPLGHIQPESLVGGNIVMERYLPGYGGARRRLNVTKVRNQQGIVTIIVVGQHGLLVASAGELDVSYLADTVLLLRYFEVDAQYGRPSASSRSGPGRTSGRSASFSSTITASRSANPSTAFGAS